MLATLLVLPLPSGCPTNPAGDMDGDGDTDLVVTNFFGDSISVLFSPRQD